MKASTAIVLVMVFVTSLIHAQSLKHFGIDAQYGFIFAHSKDVESTANSRPAGVSLEYSQLKFDSASFNLARCYPRTGFNLIYFNYDNATLGHSVNGTYFLEPTFVLAKKISFAPRGSIGLSFLTNPYHPTKNPNNNSYSLPISVFLQLGARLNFAVTNKLSLSTMVNYLHISNGGIKDPNKGINWPTASLGMHYQLNNTVFKKQHYQQTKLTKKNAKVEIGIYSSYRFQARGGKDRYLVPGTFIGYFKQLNNLHSAGLVADLHLDYSLAEKQRRIGEPLHYHFASLALGHEFLMGKFIFWQQVGYYVLPPDERYENWYHRWGLSYGLHKNVALGVSVKAHLHMAHFADVRVSYHW